MPDAEKPSMEDTMGAVFDRIQTEEREAAKSAAPDPAPAPEPEGATHAAPAKDALEGETAEQKAERLRADDGKFRKPTRAEKRDAKAPPAPEQAAKPAGKAAGAKAEPDGAKVAEKAPDAPTGSAAPPAPAAASGFTAPGGWSAAAKATWATLPPAAQAAIVQREKEVSDGFARYEGIGRALAPMRQTLQSRHVSEADYIGQMVQIDAALTNPATRAQAFDYLFRSYGYQPNAAGADPNAAGRQTPQLSADPTIAALQQQLAAVTSHLSTQEAQRAREIEAVQAETQRQATSEVAKFRDDPANEFFDLVKDDVRAVYERAAHMGQPAPSLKDAYEQAVWANPQTRPIMLGREAQKAADANAKKAADAAASARKAAGPGVRGTSAGSPTAPTGPKKSMEEEMAEVYDKMNAAD